MQSLIKTVKTLKSLRRYLERNPLSTCFTIVTYAKDQQGNVKTNSIVDRDYEIYKGSLHSYPGKLQDNQTAQKFHYESNSSIASKGGR